MSKPIISELLLFLVFFPVFLLVAEYVLKDIVSPMRTHRVQSMLFQCNCSDRFFGRFFCSGREDCILLRVAFYVFTHLRDQTNIWYFPFPMSISLFLALNTTNISSRNRFLILFFSLFSLLFLFQKSLS